MSRRRSWWPRFAIAFVAGSADRIALHLGIAYTGLVQVLRGAAVLLPLLVFLAVRAICRASVRATKDNLHRNDAGEPATRDLPVNYQPDS